MEEAVVVEEEKKKNENDFIEQTQQTARRRRRAPSRAIHASPLFPDEDSFLLSPSPSLARTPQLNNSGL